MVPYNHLHVSKSWFDCRRFHAHDVGTAGDDIYAILGPPLVLIVFIGIGVLEGDNTLFSRIVYFAAGS